LGQYCEVAPSPDIENNPELGRDFYLRFIMTAIERAISPNAAWYCWHASARQAMLVAVWNEAGAFVHQQIWVKSRSSSDLPGLHVGARTLPLRLDQEPEARRRTPTGGGYPSTVWEVPNAEIETNDHPTSKPNRLFAIPMQLHTSANDLCYEPFSGSGSQLGHRDHRQRRLIRRCSATLSAAS
jgi:hypothetical protein